MKITDNNERNYVKLNELEAGTVYRGQNNGLYIAGDEWEYDCRIVIRLDNGIVGRHHKDNLVTPLQNAELIV